MMRRIAVAFAAALYAFAGQAQIVLPGGGAGGTSYTGTAGIVSAAVSAPGTGYVPATNPNVPDVVTLSGGGATTNGTILVTATQVVSATVAAGGASCTNGAQTVTGTTGGDGWSGGSVKFQASVTVTGNAITAVNSISRAGTYYLNPTTLSAEPVTGASCSGAQLNIVMGALQGVVQTTGVYPSTQAGQTGALTQGSTSAAGTGATWTVTYAAIPSLPITTSTFGNTIEGAGAGPSVIADANTFYGFNAGNLNTFGRENTFFGYKAGSSEVGTGSFPDNGQNTFIGSFSGSTATGNANTCIGQKSCTSITSAGNTVAIGAHAATALTTGAGNIFIGHSSGDSATTTGTVNTAVGDSAGQFLTGAAAGNVFVGSAAGAGTNGANNTASNNSFVGNQAGNKNSSGSQNVAFGFQSGTAITSGSSNTCIGYQACHVQTGAFWVTALGNNAGLSNTGNGNIFLGADSGDTTPAASTNFMIIGSGASSGSERITDIYAGKGYIHATPTPIVYHATGGNGTDIAGADFTAAAGQGTGAGLGGIGHLAAAPASTTASTLNALKDALLWDQNLHLRVGNGTAPALTSCGTGSPAITGTDVAGIVTAGTAATGCVITFNKAYTSTPFCTVTWQGTPLLTQSYTISASAITLTQTSTSGDLINYMCVGQNGG